MPLATPPGQEPSPATVALVRRELDLLVEHGLLEARRGPDGVPAYYPTEQGVAMREALRRSEARAESCPDGFP